MAHLKKMPLYLAMAAALSACGSDDNDNDAEVARLQEQVAELQEQLAALDNDAADKTDVTDLQSKIDALETQITALENQIASLEDSDEDTDAAIALLKQQVADLTSQLEELTAEDPKLGANATSGANMLPEGSDKVWRFAVFPDSQGRDDDNMKSAICTDESGHIVIDQNYPGGSREICEYIGVDFNKDGFYDAGTEHNEAGAKLGDWDEDGISYLVNVEDPRNPFLETDDSGAPVIVAEQDRKDYGPDWKHLPVPLVEAIADKMIELDVDLALEVGDMTEYRAESDYVQWVDKVATPLADAGISVMPVRGNHEIVNGRNWPAWFASDFRWGRQSVNNVPNGINPYEGDTMVDFDQGRKLYSTFVGSLTQEHLTSGKAVGFPGAEELVYYFIHNNTLFIATDHYFGDLYSTSYNGHWSVIRDWLLEVITTNAEDVDHIVVFGHEPISTKKRPQTYDAAQYDEYVTDIRNAELAVEAAQANYDAAVGASASEDDLAELMAKLEDAQSDLEEIQGPSLEGYDIGQLGYLLLQSETDPDLAKEILELFTKYQVTYVSGHDHQYTRSLIHPSPEFKDTSTGFTQIITGSASWKAYENEYGVNPDYETGLFIDNFVRSDDKINYFNEAGTRIAESTNGLAKGISFVVVEVNGRQITTKEYYADHPLTEVDMNLGAYYDYDTNSWCQYFQPSAGNSQVFEPADELLCEEIEWQVKDEVTRTTDATKRVVSPGENYYAITSTPEGQGYIGTQATVLDGYNLTFNSSYANSVSRVEQLRELFTLSWFADNSDITVSDILWVSGNQTQDGSYFEYKGDAVVPVADVDNGVLAEGVSPSLTYINNRGHEVNNETHVTRDGLMKKGTDINASLNRANTNGNPGGNDAKWTDRYLNDKMDFADAVAISFSAPEGVDVQTLILGRYDEATQTWVPVFADKCYAATGYSEHFSVHYRISEQHPEGGNDIANCQQRYWGYIPSSNSVWGFIHTDGRFALIERP